MIKVVFKKHYIFKSSNDRICELTIVLPSDDEGYLVPELRDNTTSVFGMDLSKTWGHCGYPTEHTRYYTRSLFASTWEELNAEVRDFIDEVVEKLRGVYKRNSEELKRTPQDEEEVYFIE